ncbi:MAG: DUF89 family protein [Caldisericaceae bacterium]|nr:DUF89 family protein [Caldisericaceae bacterium]
MKAQLECIPCMMSQALRAAKAATNDKKLIREVLNRIGEEVKNIHLEKSTPPEAAIPVYQIVTDVTGVEDPYKNTKREHIKEALALYPLMMKKVEQSKNPLKETVKIAIAGNAIDLGSRLDKIDITKEFERIENSLFYLDEFDAFEERIEKEKEILYLADNAGETVFDRPLIELLAKRNKKIYYAVKEKPIINDATRLDAELSGIKEEIISTGSSVAGTILDYCSKEFVNFFAKATFIIAKGQGNYESLSNKKAPIFFLFKAKCKPIAKETGFKIGTMLLMKSKYFK